MESARRGSSTARAEVAQERRERTAELRARFSAEAFEAHDLRMVGWLVLERVFFAEMESSEASAAATVMRALMSLGDSPESEDRQLAEIELRGMLMNGFQPRDDEEWALAAELFGEQALEEFRRWRKLPPREPRDGP